MPFGTATRWWKNFEDMFIRFDTTHERDRHTDTAWRHRHTTLFTSISRQRPDLRFQTRSNLFKVTCWEKRYPKWGGRQLSYILVNKIRAVWWKNWFCCFLPPHFGYLFSQQVCLQRFVDVVVAAVGCADPEIDSDTTWLRRQHDTAIVGCKTDNRQWTMRCVDSHWTWTWTGDHNATCIPGRSFPSTGCPKSETIFDCSHCWTPKSICIIPIN